MKKRSVSRNFNKNISSKKNKSLWWIIALIIIIGVFIVAWRYYGENLNVGLSPPATCLYGVRGSAGCYDFIEDKGKYRIYFDPTNELTDIYGRKYLKTKVYITDVGVRDFNCTYSYGSCLTPVDTEAFEVSDTGRNKDCVNGNVNIVNNGVLNGANCVAPQLNLKPGVAYPQFGDLIWSYPAGKVRFFTEDQEDVYPGFDYSSGAISTNKNFMTQIISTPIYSSESVAFNLQSSRPGDNIGSGTGKIYEMNMTLKDGNNIIFRASSYCDLTSGANGVKRTIIEGIGLTKKVITAASCPLTFGGSEGNGGDSRVELKPSDLSLIGKGSARIMGTDYFFNEFTANRPLTLEFKVSRRADMRHNLRLTKFDGGPGNPNKLARSRAPLVLNWEKGSYLQSINKWVWNTGTQTVSNVKIKAEIRNETNDIIGVYQTTATIPPKSEAELNLRPFSAGVGTTIDPSRGIHLPYDLDGTCYDIKFYLNNQFFDEGFDICVGK